MKLKPVSKLENTTAYFRDEYVPFKQASLSIASAPFLYGLCIYTCFPVFWNDKKQTLYMFRLSDHFKRLQNSAKIMAFDEFLAQWSFLQFEQAMRQLLLKNKLKQDSLVRVSVFVDDILKGTRMHSLKHSLSAFVYPATPFFHKDSVELCVSSWQRTQDNAIPSRAKVNGSYVNSALMKHEAELNGFDDAVALDVQGHVSESTVANIFLVKDGRLVTPSGTSDLLEGITRDTVFKLANKLGIVSEQRTIDRSELYLADEMFLCGSSANITPVISVDRRAIGTGQPGAITKKLLKTYLDVGHGQNSFLAEWLTPVNVLK